MGGSAGGVVGVLVIITNIIVTLLVVFLMKGTINMFGNKGKAAARRASSRVMGMPSIANGACRRTRGRLGGCSLKVRGSATPSSAITGKGVVDRSPTSKGGMGGRAAIGIIVDDNRRTGVAAVPDIINLTRTSTRGTLRTGGLIIGGNSPICDSSIRRKRIISIDPDRNTRMGRKAAIALMVDGKGRPAGIPGLAKGSRSSTRTTLSRTNLSKGTARSCDSAMRGKLIVSRSASTKGRMSGNAAVKCIIDGKPGLAIIPIPDVVSFSGGATRGGLGRTKLAPRCVNSSCDSGCPGNRMFCRSIDNNARIRGKAAIRCVIDGKRRPASPKRNSKANSRARSSKGR